MGAPVLRPWLNLGNLIGMHLTQATAFDGKVLCKDKDCTTIDRTIASYNPITRQVFLFLAEIGATMFHKFIKLYKTALVQKELMRSRAVIFPESCCLATLLAPPPASIVS